MNKKLGLISDLHIGCRNGNKAMREWIQEYLKYALTYFKDNKITDVVQLGDFWDIRRSLLGEDMWWLVNEFLPMLADYGITWHQICGNHTSIRKDETGKITWDYWLERESIAHGSHSVKSYTSPQDLKIGDTLYAIVPWINKSNVEETKEYLAKTEATVTLGHYELADFVLQGKSLAKSGTLAVELLEKFDYCLSGHYHQSSYKTLKSGTLVKYLGSPYELTTGDRDDCTERGLYIQDTLTQELIFTKNPEGMSIFAELEYNYTNIAAARKGKKYLDKSYLEEVLHLKDKVIRINVTDRSSSVHYRSFLDTLRLVKCVNFNVVDLTKEIETFEQDVTAEEFKVSTLDVLRDKVNDTEGINHEGVDEKLKKVYSICLDKSNLI